MLCGLKNVSINEMMKKAILAWASRQSLQAFLAVIAAALNFSPTVYNENNGP